MAADLDDVDALLDALERELRATGRLAFATCELLRDDARLAGLEPCLTVLGCSVLAGDRDAPPAIERRRRLQVCRLMLLGLGAHTPAPRWTVLQVEQLVAAASRMPGGVASDVGLAAFALAGEHRGPVTQRQAAFLRQLGDQVAALRRRARDAAADDFVWLAVRVADPMLPVTEAQALLAAHALPRRLRHATREILLAAVRASPVADEVARALAE